ncbi:hypothetical protein CEP51_009256 [Fusarium floridanum]|uniref:Uncharacterized protein n=1 Tax=Fusarium floridanum TaxID=1325733 RepID=A0A428RI81_9HYPO|nr:hypothetical protein CEP51_009256 [Fusarium floridanum]
MSLRSLGLEHPWLLTHPLFWTAQHLDLVGCRFQSVDGDGSSNHAGVETGLHDARKCDQVSTQMAEIFAKSLALKHKTCSLINVLQYNGGTFEQAKDPLVFTFAKRPIDKPECTVFHIAKQSIEERHRDALPIVGYFDYQTIISKRRQKLKPRPHPCKGYNGPVQRLCQRKLCKVTPQTWSQDPYLLCTLLSMAQSLALKSRSAQPNIYVTRLLVTTKSDQEYVHLFEAEIPSKLLDLFDDPTLSMKHVCWPTIHHSKLPFQPYSTFQMRLTARLIEVHRVQGPLGAEPANFDGSKVISNKRKLTEENNFSRRVKLKG